MVEATASRRGPSTQMVLEAAFRDDRGFLLGVLYRLVGSLTDAEDLVQATFERALERPPADTQRAWRPWLTQVALNLGRDHLRRRRRRRYDGPWLPGPLETPEGELPFGVAEPADTQGRYERMESVSFAFLLALEGLTPTQRAVLLLRDVFEYDGRETATALGLSEANVRQHLHRARRAMHAYERDREHVREPSRDEARALIGRFLLAVAQGDVGSVEAMLTEDVVLLNDAGGEFHASRLPVYGANKVARFFVNIARLSGPPSVSIRRVNGLPAVVMDLSAPKPGIAPRVVTLAELGTEGRIRRMWSVLARRKLEGLDPQLQLGRTVPSWYHLGTP